MARSVLFILLVYSALLASCHVDPLDPGAKKKDSQVIKIDTTIVIKDTIKSDADTVIKNVPVGSIDTKNVAPADLVEFSKSLIGTPYRYASTNPAEGFDCSGFITYVFNHFGINVPRSSIDFTNVGTPVDEKQSMPGDLILFTGTDSTEKFVGHMGLVVETNPLSFIHSTSGKKYGVTITPLNDYYRSRFVKIIRIFPQKG